MTNPRQHEQRDCPRFYNCLTRAALNNLKAVPCKECNKQQEVEMAKSPQVTCTKETYGRLEKIRKESKLKWVEFLKACGVSRSQWDCIRHLKPMGQVVYERVAKTLNVPYEWLMDGELGEGVKFVQDVPHIIKGSTGAPVHDAGYPLPKKKE